MLTDPATPHLVTGKWSLSSSGRITFSLKEDGFTERYSAEVCIKISQSLLYSV